MDTLFIRIKRFFYLQMLLAGTILFFINPLVGQTVYQDYHDGRIYLKYKDNIVPHFSVRSDNKVDIEDVPAVLALKNSYRLKELSRPFDLNHDQKLSRTLMLEFEDFEKVDEIINQLKSSPDLEYVERVPYDRIDFSPNDTLYTLYNGPQNWNWHLERIQADLAWDITKGSPDIKVAIVDNAVWVDHPDLAGKIVAQRDTYYNTDNPNPPSTGDPAEWSHGTHCAGLAAASSNNEIGVASVGFDVSIIAVKAAANTNANSIYGYTGIQWAAANGADVISMSWGGSGY